MSAPVLSPAGSPGSSGVPGETKAGLGAPPVNGRPAESKEPAKRADTADAAKGADPKGGESRVEATEVKPAAKAAPAKKAAKAKAPAGLTVTLAYGDGEWTVAASQGAKALAKPYVIKASEALKMVSMLDVPGVQEAVEEIVSAARAEAEQAAERLRAELAEIEARLAELRD